jgi:hypothetical protein
MTKDGGSSGSDGSGPGRPRPHALRPRPAERRPIELPPREPRPADPRSTEPRSTDARSTEPRSTEPRATEPRSTERGPGEIAREPGRRPDSAAPGARGGRVRARVSLEPRRAQLALPDEERIDESLELDVPLRVDTAELALDEILAAHARSGMREVAPDDDRATDLSLDDAPSDGWSRWRDGEPSVPAPARLSSTPPAGSRDDAIGLVSRRSRPPSSPVPDLASDMDDRYALGDYTGALRVAELLLGQRPDDERAQRCADDSRARLIKLHTARLASLCGTTSERIRARTPHIAVPEHEIRWLGLDHRQGFLLSRLDGHSTIDDLHDLTGMTELEILRTLVELLEAKAITFE